MGRDLTPFIIQSLTPNDDGGLSVRRPAVALDIRLRDPERTVVRWATSDITVSTINVMGVSQPFGPYQYANPVRDVPNVKFTAGHAADAGSFTCQNVDGLIGEMAGSLETLFNKADITIHYCFLKPDGTYEADTIMVGKVVKVGGDPALCTFSVTSDMNDRGAVVAAPILRQRLEKCWPRG